MTGLNEDEFEQLVETTRGNKDVIIACIILPNCPKCVEYQPVFNQAKENHPDLTFVKTIAGQGSKLKRTYLKVEVGERASAPCTIMVYGGVMRRRRFGPMTAEQLEEFINMAKEL